MRGTRRALSDDDLAQMRAAFASGGVTMAALARVYGVSTSTVSLWIDPSSAERKLKRKTRGPRPAEAGPRCPRCGSLSKGGATCGWCVEDIARRGF